jgi:hypothetical protein
LISLEIADQFELGRFFWLVGALIGGSSAYVAEDVQGFWKGLRRAVATVGTWRPDTRPLRYAGYCAIGGFSLAMYASSVVVVLAVGILGAPPAEILPGAYALAVFGGMVAFLVFGISLTTASELSPERREEVLNFSREFAREVAPWHAIPYVIRNIPAALRATVKGLVVCSCVTWRIGVQTFVYVHTARRRLCFVSATLGAAIGFFLGSAMLGAVAGFVIGAVSYEIVTRRWLKIDPIQS